MPRTASETRAAGSTRRDRLADAGLVLFAGAFSFLSAGSVLPEDGAVSENVLFAEALAAGVACLALLLRRRWPVPLAVAMLVADSFGHFFIGPTLVAVFTVAAHRPLRATGWITALVFARLVGFLASVPDPEDPRTGAGVAYFSLVTAALVWGLYRRSRRQLVASLRERAEQAEADAALRAEQAQRRAREEIAREMHDVLAHRLSLLSVHAGALEFHPGAPPAEVARAAGVIRDSAHEALQDLRDVIGVLRAPADAAAGAGRPQPTLGDVDRLVAEAGEAGMRIAYAPDVAAPEAVPAATGRTAYRIVQEGLTNARKHAAGTKVTVTLTGSPEKGLTVEVGNPLPGAAGVADGPRTAAVLTGGQAAAGRDEYGRAAAGARPGAGRGAGTDRAAVAALAAKPRGGPGGLAGAPVTVPGPGGRSNGSAVRPGAGATGPIPGAGQGLVGLAERAALAGGRLVHTADGDGFHLRAWLPWGRPSRTE
ncbi:sensor histidine kinase [Streptomyces sp. CMB-StM0423]|uniref:sensor histidine kinase n=1 Tax=Streptomyces sp. CMB-StM0423 TaxID=2059884 RepID=UPI000C715546|nr:histidine kinase [Streptomyces sp. CMB-StM0423]AUH39761.1 histidine kinase [Streptomyces sp. CMB-StM0423]